jgi:hypothetical protein
LVSLKACALTLLRLQFDELARQKQQLTMQALAPGFVEDLEALEYELRPVKAQQDPPTTKIKIPNTMTTCRDPKSQAGSNSEMQELERMHELLGGMTQTDFNQQMSTTTEETVHARKARSVREAIADVATPVRTSARNNGENEATPSTIPTPKTAQDNGKAAPATPGTRGRASNPTPKALFTRAQRERECVVYWYSI